MCNNFSASLGKNICNFPLYFRYIAVHNPLDYNQAMNDENAIRRRLLKYLLPVVFASVVFNIPKFFESRVSYANITEMVSILLHNYAFIFEVKYHLCKFYTIYKHFLESWRYITFSTLYIHTSFTFTQCYPIFCLQKIKINEASDYQKIRAAWMEIVQSCL